MNYFAHGFAHIDRPYFAAGTILPDWLAAHDRALEYEFDIYVGGHLNRVGTREDVRIGREYVQDVRTNAGQALQTTDFMAIAQKVGFANSWALFKTYLDAVSQSCTDATLAKWGKRLGGADVYTFSHCWEMQTSLRND